MSRWPTWLVWVGVIALAVGLRAAYLWSSEPLPVLWDAGVNVTRADDVAACLIRGEGVPDRWDTWWTLGGRLYAFRMLYIRNPLFVLLIAPTRAFFPESVAPVLLLNVLAEAATTLLLMLLTLRIGGSRPIAAFAGVLYAIYFPSYVASIQVLPDIWGACAATFLTYALVQFADNPRDWRSGLLLCAAVVVAPLMREHLAIAVIIALPWLALTRPWAFRKEDSNTAERAAERPPRRMLLLITLLGLIAGGFPIIRQVITPAPGWSTSFQTSFDGWGGRPLRLVPDDWKPAYTRPEDLSRRERLLFLTDTSWLAQSAERGILAWSRPYDIQRREWLLFRFDVQHYYHRILWLSALAFLPLALLRDRWQVILIVVLVGITLPVAAGGRPETRYNILGIPLVVALASQMLSLTALELIRSVRARERSFTLLAVSFVVLLALAALSDSPPGVARFGHWPLYLLSRAAFACAFLAFPLALLLRSPKNSQVKGVEFCFNAAMLTVFAGIFIAAAARQPLWRETHFGFQNQLEISSTITIAQTKHPEAAEVGTAWLVMDLAFSSPKAAVLTLTAKNGARRSRSLDAKSLVGEMPFGPHSPSVDFRWLELRRQMVAEIPKWLYIPLDSDFVRDVLASGGYNYELQCQGAGRIGADFVGQDLVYQLPAVEPFAQTIYRYLCVGDYRVPRLYQVSSRHQSTVQGDLTRARPRIYLVALLKSGEVIVR